MKQRSAMKEGTPITYHQGSQGDSEQKLYRFHQQFALSFDY